MDQRREALGEPPAVVVDAPEGIASRSGPPEDEPLAGHRHRRRDGVDGDVDEEQHAEFGEEAQAPARQQQVGDEDAEPLNGGQRDDEGQSHRLGQAAERPPQQGRRGEAEVADGRLGADAAGALDERVGHRPQGALGVDVGKGDAGERRGLAHRRDEPRGEQGMSAEVGEEIPLQRNRLRAEDLLRGGEQSRFGVVLRRLLFPVGGDHRQGGHLEGLAIDLAGGQARQGLGHLEMAWHHVGRHLGGEALAQGRDLQALPPLRDEEGDKPVHPVVGAQHHRRLIDLRHGPDPRFDLAQFDPEAPDLHLIVDAAVEDDPPLGIEGDRVARTVKHRVGPVRGEGVGDKLFRRQLRPLEIAPRHAGAADQQFSLLAPPEKGQFLARDVDGVVWDWPADRHRLAGTHLGGGRHHRRLRGPVGVEQLARGRRPLGDEGFGQGLSAEEDEPDLRQVAGDHGEQRRHRVEHRDAVGRDDARQSLHVAHHGRARHEEARPHQVGDPNLLHRQVEGDGGPLEHHVVGAHPVERVPRTEEMADVGVGNDDALGHPRRARGVDEVGGVPRRQALRPRVRARRLPGRGGIEGGRREGRRPDGGLTFEGGRDEQSLGGGIIEANAHPVGRGLGIEGQPRGPGQGDADLRHEEVGSSGHPQAHHVAGADAPMSQAGGDPTGPGGDFGIGEVRMQSPGGEARPIDQTGMVGASSCGGEEDLGQNLVADEIGPPVPMEHRRVPGRRGGQGRRSGPGCLGEVAHALLRWRPHPPAPVIVAPYSPPTVPIARRL